MPTALLLTHHFPPSFAVGGKRAWRFARHLPAHGWRVVVLTVPLAADAPRDGSLDTALGPDARVVRTALPSWWPRAGGAGSDGTVTAPTVDPVYPPPAPLARAAWQLKPPLGRDALATPWVAARVRQLLREQPVDLLWATSSPYACLLWGAAATAIAGGRLRLCLDLRDPWSLNFLQQRKPPWARRVEAALEARLLRRASRVTVTSEATASAYRARYPALPAERFVCIENGYDDPPPMPPPRPGEEVELVHFGNVYGRRSLAPVLRAMASLRSTAPRLAARLRLINLGRVGAADLELAAELGLSDAMVVEPAVPHAEGLRRLAAADLQIMLGYGDETLFLPAKLFDYMASGAAVLAVEQPSDATRIVREHQLGRAAAPDDIPAIRSALAQAVEARDGGPALRADREPPPRYSARQGAARLAALFDEILSP